MVFHVVKLILAMVMLLCAILVWRRTRDTTWVLLVCTAIFWYVQIVLDFLETVALLPPLSMALRIIIHALPLIAFSLAFLKFKYDRDLF